jgi:hypothetical protein
MAIEKNSLLKTPSTIFKKKEIIYKEDFKDMKQIWVEGNKDDVYLENGCLIIAANKENTFGATIFINKKFKGNLLFEYTAEGLESDKAYLEYKWPFDIPDRTANNMNTFLYYSDPSGKDLYESRNNGGRKKGEYSAYHMLNGYIVTHLNGHIEEYRFLAEDPDHKIKVKSNSARTRVRSNPGFELLDECIKEKIFLHKKYRLQFLYKDGELYFFRNNKYILHAKTSSDKKYDNGYFGFRTWKTKLAINDFQVSAFE